MSRDPYQALRFPAYRWYSIGGLLSGLTGQCFSVALGWEIYERTHDPFSLGLVGLVQAGPVIALALPAGDLADRVDRRRLMLAGYLVAALCFVTLGMLSRAQAPVAALFTVVLFEAIAQAIAGPARSAILPQLVSDDALGNAIAWNTSRWQLAATAGPALGGALVALFGTAWPVYFLAATGALFFCGCLLFVHPRPLPPEPLREESPLQRLAAGVRFVRATPLVLATISMDMFAVLLGGAVALLPIFAKDILHVGPKGLGWLRAAPAVGALAVGLSLAHLPPMRRSGLTLLCAVTGFGVATIVFGVSTHFWLSFVALALTGGLDNVSVVVRETLLQRLTPARMRGRVAAVNSVFVGVSNEIGAFESGLVARFFGAVASVILGGVGSIAVVLATARIWPQVPALGAMDDLVQAEEES